MRPAKKAEPENLYRTIYDIEGVKHYYRHHDELDRAADDLAEKMAGYGLKVREQEFRMDGCDKPFRNIEGSLGPVGEAPAAVVMAHYDTVDTAPGANDDGSGIAAMLETARLLAGTEEPPPVFFVAVGQEENSNPAIFTPEYESALKHGVKDKNHFFTSWAAAEGFRKLHEAAMADYFGGGTIGGGYRKALSEKGSSVPAGVRKHIEDIIPLYENIDVLRAIGTLNRMGSCRWVREAMEAGRNIAFNITLDEIGIYSDKPYSQGELDERMPLFEHMAGQFGTDPDNRRGNFVFALSDAAGRPLAERFFAACASDDIRMPCGGMPLPMDFDAIRTNLPQALHADHAAFWQAGIPALFLMDTANARDPWVHTPADTIDKIDFDKLARLTDAVAAVLVEGGFA